MLRLLHTTDVHMALLAYDYSADAALPGRGLGHTASLIRAARDEVPNSLLLEGGDYLQGNALGDFLARRHAESDPFPGPHPAIAAMNLLSYDVATLGNHEFNFGLDFLNHTLSEASFPVVCANVTQIGAGAAGAPILPPYILLDRQIEAETSEGQKTLVPLRIGVLGLVPPQVAIWDKRHLQGRAHSHDAARVARDMVPRMRAEGADIVIALNHSGIADLVPMAMTENAGVELAQIPGIDALLCGHQHAVFPNQTGRFSQVTGADDAAGSLSGVPTLMSGFWGSHLGVLHLHLVRDGSGRWSVTGHQAEQRPTAERKPDGSLHPLTPEDPALVAAVRPAHEATLAYFRQPIGETRHPLHSFFALQRNDRALQLVARAQAWRAASFLEDSPLSHLPLLSAVAPFKCGGPAGPGHFTEIPAGPLTLRHISDLYQFPNALRVVQISGRELRDWLERSAGIFNRATPGGTEEPLLNPAFPSYNFDVIHGLRYRIDLSQNSRFDLGGNLQDPGARRIRDLTYRGAPLADDALFLVATNSYRAGGGGNFAGAQGDSVVLSVPENSFEVLQAYVAASGPIDEPIEDVWGFSPLPGAALHFDTGPNAAHYLAESPEQIELIGPQDTGFVRFRINF